MTSLLFALILTGAIDNAPPQMPGSTGICHAQEAVRAGALAGVRVTPLPSPDLILRLQEIAARDRGRAERAIMMMTEQQPDAHNLSPEPQFHPLGANERRDLRVALQRFFRENAGKIIDARTGKELQRSVSDAPAGQ
jgi:hypothetical protein